MMASLGRRWAAIGLCIGWFGCGGNGKPVVQQPPPAVATQVPASASELRYEGRFEGDPASPHFEWPGSTVWLRFEGTSAAGTDVKVTLGERSLENDDYGQVAHDWYDVAIDGKPAAALQVDEGVHSYLVAQGLAKGEHVVALRRRTEAYVGEGELDGFELGPGARVLPAPAATRRIEFIGDSITAGFGVDGSDRSCLFSAQTENYSHSYAALTAQALGAEQVAIAATGAGVYRNWGGSKDNTIGDLYDRALPTHSTSRWNFARWKPDVVVINLGTNDFTSGDPGSANFTAAYRALLARVRQNYPAALIVVALGPMLSDLWPAGANALTQSRAYLTSVVSDANAAGDAQVKLLEFDNQDQAASFGCKFHPSAQTQQQMADKLSAFLRTQLHW